MRKTQKDIAAPGCCIICRQTRVLGDEFMVETGSLNDFGVMTPLTGQIYVCYVCIEALAKAAGGYVKEADVERERADFEASREDLAVVDEALVELGSRAIAVQNLAVKASERLAKRQAEGSG